jgi:hypothetical protein
MDESAAATRSVLAVALGRRLRDIISRRAAGGSTAAGLEVEFVKAVPGLLLPEILTGTSEDLTEASRAAALEQMLNVEFDSLPAEIKRNLLSFYGQLRAQTRPGQLEQILRRIYRANDDDQPETRAQACRTMAVFLPDLQAKVRTRCFDALQQAASDSDSGVSESARDALRLIYGHLTKSERAALRQGGIRVS